MPSESPVKDKSGRDERIRKFIDFVRAQDLELDLTYDDVVQSQTRAELGISSLSMLILVASYIEASGSQMALDPEWVPMLDDVDGILAVFSQIDGE